MSTASSDLLFGAGPVRRPLTVKRHARAKSLRLRIDPRDGRVVLTLPKRASLKAALRWAEGQRGWIEDQLAGIEPGEPIEAGRAIPFRGERLVIDWHRDWPRTPALDDGRLLLGGPEESVEPRVLRWLRNEARTVLTAESRAYAERAEVTITTISIGDARTRWGSCSASGALRYNWRLVMAPSAVLSATAAHEVAHRVHMNHGPDFHALVETLFGRDPKAERDWLRRNGASLYRIGSSS